MNIPGNILDMFGVEPTEEPEENLFDGLKRISLRTREGFIWFQGIVALEEIEYENEVKITVLKPEYQPKLKGMDNLVFGDIRFKDKQDVCPETLSEKERDIAQKLLEKERTERDQASWTVTGRIFSDVPTYYDWDTEHRFKTYNLESEETWEIHVHSIAEAKKWVIENHPEHFVGCSIRQNFPSGDLYFSAVPGMEYGEGNYESKALRTAYAKSMA